VKNDGIILDSNLLVLWVVGNTAIDYIGSHKNLKNFTKADFDLLFKIVLAAPRVLATPNILTETSNLVRQFGQPGRDRITIRLGEIIQTIDEKYIDSKIAANRPDFKRLGLADSALLHALDKRYVLVTTDFDLYRSACEAGFDPVNFNHLRMIAD
jgi:hypothetical protein